MERLAFQETQVWKVKPGQEVCQDKTVHPASPEKRATLASLASGERRVTKDNQELASEDLKEDLVFQVHQDKQVPQVEMVNQAQQVDQASMEKRVTKVSQVLQDQHQRQYQDYQAIRVNQASQDCQVPKEIKVFQVPQASKVHQVNQVHQDPMEIKVQRETQVCQVSRDRRERQVHSYHQKRGLRENRVNQASQAIQGIVVRRDDQASLASLGHQNPRVTLDLVVGQDSMEDPAQKDLQEKQVTPAHQVLRALRVNQAEMLLTARMHQIQVSISPDIVRPLWFLSVHWVPTRCGMDTVYSMYKAMRGHMDKILVVPVAVYNVLAPCHSCSVISTTYVT